jgi:hypothetical protein
MQGLHVKPQRLDAHIVMIIMQILQPESHCTCGFFFFNAGITLIALCSLTFYVLCTKVLQYVTNS